MENKENKENKELKPNPDQVSAGRLEIARMEGISKGAWTAAFIALAVLIALAVFGYYMYKTDHNEQLALMDDQKTAFSLQLTERDSVINEWLLTFDQIEQDLAEIKEKEKIINVASSDSEISKSRKDKIREDIRYINTLLEANKQKIASLNAQLKKTGVTMKALEDKVATLEASVKQYESDINEMKTALANKEIQIEQLNTRVTGLDQTIAQQTETISTQIAEMNKAYLISGTFKDLRDRGILSKEGGFLGIGRKEAIIEDFSDTLFAQIDITEIKMIPVNAKNAKLITEHPTGSYELIRQDEKTVESIEIKDPGQFWKISKYAVVELVK